MASEQKKLFVQELTRQVSHSPLIGIVNLQHLPAKQLQKMRALLRRNDIKLLMARKKMLELALQNSGKEKIQPLQEKITGMPAILLSSSNPFALYKIIQKNKSEAPAKAGQAAPRDIVVKAGPTNFAPGPIISEFAAVGIKTKVEAGKLAIISDVVIVREGQAISAKVAETLKRLDIKPMEVGLSLVAVWENGLVFDAKQLHIDEAEYLSQIMSAAQWAVNLALEAAYLTAETTELLLQKAFREAKALALEQNIITDLNAEEIIGNVERQAQSLLKLANLPEKKGKSNEVEGNNHSSEKKEIKGEHLRGHKELREEPGARPGGLEMNHGKDNGRKAAEIKEADIIKEAEVINSDDSKLVDDTKRVDNMAGKLELSNNDYNNQRRGYPESIAVTENNQKKAYLSKPNKETIISEKNNPQLPSFPETAANANANTNNNANDLPTAQELIKQTISRSFDKDNASIRAERAAAKAFSAEKLVDEELKIAQQELAQRMAQHKKDASIREAEELYQKLKKTGTLRE